MGFLHSFVGLLPLMLIAAAGYFIMHIGLVDEKLRRNMVRVGLFVIVPCFILSTLFVETTPELLQNALTILLLGAVLAVALTAVGHFAGSRAKGEGRLWRLFLFPNMGLLGFCAVLALFSREGAFYAVLFSMPFMAAMFISTPLHEGKEDKKSSPLAALLNPCMVACAAGLLMLFTGLRPPLFLRNTAELIAGLVVAMGLLATGMALKGAPVKQIFSLKWAYLVALCRLVLVPAVVFAALFLLGARGYMAAAPTLCMAAPPLLSDLPMDGDEGVRRRAVALSTLVAAVTMPLWAAFLGAVVL